MPRRRCWLAELVPVRALEQNGGARVLDQVEPPVQEVRLAAARPEAVRPEAVQIPVVLPELAPCAWE